MRKEINFDENIVGRLENGLSIDNPFPSSYIYYLLRQMVENEGNI